MARVVATVGRVGLPGMGIYLSYRPISQRYATRVRTVPPRAASIWLICKKRKKQIKVVAARKMRPPAPQTCLVAKKLVLGKCCRDVAIMPVVYAYARDYGAMMRAGHDGGRGSEIKPNGAARPAGESGTCGTVESVVSVKRTPLRFPVYPACWGGCKDFSSDEIG